MQKRYWLRWGIIYTVVGVIVIAIVISFSLFEPWHAFEQSNGSQSAFTSAVFGLFSKLALAGLVLFGPAWMALGLGLGMRDSAPEASEYAVAIIIGIILQLVYSFFIGATLGWLYGKFAAKNKGKHFIVSLIIIAVILGLFFNYRNQGSFAAYDSITSSEECNDFSKKLIDNFDTNRCFQYLAVKTKDVTICNNITRTSSIEKDPEDYKWFCYQEVASAADDPFICESIPTQTYHIKSNRTSSSRRDVCYNRFLLCEKIIDSGWKKDCLQNKQNQSRERTMQSENSRTTRDVIPESALDASPKAVITMEAKEASVQTFAGKVVVGDHILLPNASGQKVTIYVQGNTLVQGLNLNVQVADGGSEAGGKINGPKISDVDIISGTIFAENNTGSQNPRSVPQIGMRTITTRQNTVKANGLLATITLDTTSFFSGTWKFSLKDTLNGPTDFAGLSVDIQDGNIIIK